MSGNSILHDMMEKQMYTSMGMDHNTATLLAFSNNGKEGNNNSSSQLMTMMALNGGMGGVGLGGNNNPLQTMLTVEALNKSDNPALTMMMLQQQQQQQQNNSGFSRRQDRDYRRSREERQEMARYGRDVFNGALNANSAPTPCGYQAGAPMQQQYPQPQYGQQQYQPQPPMPQYGQMPFPGNMPMQQHGQYQAQPGMPMQQQYGAQPQAGFTPQYQQAQMQAAQYPIATPTAPQMQMPQPTLRRTSGFAS